MTLKKSKKDVTGKGYDTHEVRNKNEKTQQDKRRWEWEKTPTKGGKKGENGQRNDERVKEESEGGTPMNVPSAQGVVTGAFERTKASAPGNVWTNRPGKSAEVPLPGPATMVVPTEFRPRKTCRRPIDRPPWRGKSPGNNGRTPFPRPARPFWP